MAVIDAFKNLIRHGKHAQPQSSPATTNTNTSNQASNQTSNPSFQQSSTTSIPVGSVTKSPSNSSSSTGNKNVEQKSTQVGQGQGYSGVIGKGNIVERESIQTTEPMLSPQYRSEAEQIVREEREQREKLPQYAGLEGFSLVEKMGDGAFSNVYKAVDKTSGKKVAVKVVRKYELNSSQLYPTFVKHLGLFFNE